MEDSPILDDIILNPPTIGAGRMPICQQCTEHLKHDYDHLIANEVESMAIPSEVMTERLRDLLKLRRGQRGT